MKQSVLSNFVLVGKKHPRLRSQDHPLLQAVGYVWVAVSLAFSLLPLFVTIMNAFKSNSAVAANIFTFPTAQILTDAKNNFGNAWTSVWRPMLNSVLVSFVAAFFNMFIASIMAYIYTRKNFYGKEFFFKFYIIILLVPSILGMSILYPMMAETFHLKNSYFAIWIPVLAGGQAGALFLFRTFFGQQPSSVYESAQLDGANDIQIYIHLTLPFSLPIMLLNFVGTFGGQYNDFLWPSLILEGDKLTLMPVLNALADEFNATKQGVGYAAYLIASIPLIITSAFSLSKLQSGDFAAGLKL